MVEFVELGEFAGQHQHRGVQAAAFLAQLFERLFRLRNPLVPQLLKQVAFDAQFLPDFALRLVAPANPVLTLKTILNSRFLTQFPCGPC